MKWINKNWIVLAFLLSITATYAEVVPSYPIEPSAPEVAPGEFDSPATPIVAPKKNYCDEDHQQFPGNGCDHPIWGVACKGKSSDGSEGCGTLNPPQCQNLSTDQCCNSKFVPCINSCTGMYKNPSGQQSENIAKCYRQCEAMKEKCLN